MYLNSDNPPDTIVQIAAPRLDTERQMGRITRISRLLMLIGRARERISYCQQQYDTHSFLSSPFVSREQWQEDMRRWAYITRRLERYYLKKICELNSEAYKEVSMESAA